MLKKNKKMRRITIPNEVYVSLKIQKGQLGGMPLP